MSKRYETIYETTYDGTRKNVGVRSRREALAVRRGGGENGSLEFLGKRKRENLLFTKSRLLLLAVSIGRRTAGRTAGAASCAPSASPFRYSWTEYLAWYRRWVTKYA